MALAKHQLRGLFDLFTVMGALGLLTTVMGVLESPCDLLTTVMSVLVPLTVMGESEQSIGVPMVRSESAGPSSVIGS